MKRASTLTIACFALAAAWILRTPAAATAPDARAASDEPSDRLVVHEWGTFTTFSGSDGVRLDFRPLVENDLPEFVLDRGTQSGEPGPFAKGRIRARVRMETPVTYFYTARERDVTVRVGFPQGLLTEFYPPVARMEPPFRWAAALKGEKIGDSRLDWGTVHLIPADRLRTRVEDDVVARRVERRLFDALVPPTAAGDHYGHARETDSAIVHASFPPDKENPLRPAGDYFEKFLFYRGVGRFELPLALESPGGGAYRLANSGPHAVRSLFLVTVRGEEIRFREWRELEAGGAMTLHEPAGPGSIDALASAVERALVREGLYEKEARAMVKTWRSSWFGEEGTRLLYVVPRMLTDALLPLTVEPAPDETVRVLVGRMEILSTEEEARMIEVVRHSALHRAELDAFRQAAAAEGKEVPPYALPEELHKLGRLAEPALVRLKSIAKDDEVRAEAERLLRELIAALERETAAGR